MPELSLEAMERLLSKQLENLPPKRISTIGLSEMIQFLTKQAAHKDDLKELVTREHLASKFA